MRETDSRATRIRRTRCVAAGTVVAACGAVTVIAFGMPAGADSAAHPARSRHAYAAGRLTTPSTTGAPHSAAASRAPARTKTAGPTDSSGVSPLAAGGIPKVALNAYRVAAARLAHAQPSCGIEWYLLAGIGRVESDHGRFGGAVLHTDGVSTPSIIGPALNGRGNQFIPAPANGVALDGDATYAHALGPMQFIPSTWAGWGADANGDGKADIFNINDAALGAARYLCAAGGDLRAGTGQSRAVLSYNHLTSYRNEVLALADAYRRGITPTAALIGNTTGSLPKTGHTGALPPATAGMPIATAPRRAGPSGNARTTSTAPGRGPQPSRSAPTQSHSRTPGTQSSSPRPSTQPSCSTSSASSSSASSSATETPSPSTTATSSPSASASSSAACGNSN